MTGTLPSALVFLAFPLYDVIKLKLILHSIFYLVDGAHDGVHVSLLPEESQRG